LQTQASRFADESEITLPPPRRRPWRIALPVLLVIALAVGVGWYFFRPVAGPPTATVRRGTIISSVETTGKLEAQTKASLAFKMSGRVEKILVKEGAKIEPGDVLAQLDTESLQRQLDEARTQLDI